eukprot:2702746-Pleurochrysis_carterae.AAC.5
MVEGESDRPIPGLEPSWEADMRRGVRRDSWNLNRNLQVQNQMQKRKTSMECEDTTGYSGIQAYQTGTTGYCCGARYSMSSVKLTKYAFGQGMIIHARH